MTLVVPSPYRRSLIEGFDEISAFRTPTRRMTKVSRTPIGFARRILND
jgi:hypothetical protein